MKFIVDESAGMAVVEHLREAGHDVMAVGETMPQANDVQILETAEKESRILITNDKDFGELVYRTGQAHFGVLLLRLRDEGSANRVHMVRSIMDSYADQLVGHFVVATEKAVRIRSVD